ncbi:MAG TPA: xanthine dehydrogenase family protein molybdopterin-binding subunit [Burkholderiales bacterium]|nr:xanthine dehydrogenase family protein molybdopterin-binding subunit [Burkholderiales bacterium]
MDTTINPKPEQQQEQKLKIVGTRPVRPDGVPKVTGLARYGADYALPGMLWGKILRSPHAHARIRSIDTSQAAALPGVKAVMTAADLPEQKFEYVGPERVAVNFWHVTRNIMAREKVLYEGHPVAAVAALSKAIAEEALRLIQVDYEVLPHVIEVEEAMAPEAPLLFEDMVTRGVEPPPKPSNISKRIDLKLGDVESGFAAADHVVQMSFKTAPVHQGYIEPQACLARFDPDGQAELWASSQGHFVIRSLTSRILGMPMGNLRVHAAEIGGGFGGKNVPYVEPVALVLARKSGHPVKIVMSREEVFKACGPAPGASMTVKLGLMKDGRMVAAEGIFKFQAGAFPTSPVMNACMCGFAPYDIANVRAVGYDVVCNRPKTAAYRAPGSPISCYAVESVVDMAAQQLKMDPLKLRLMNVAKPGTPTVWGPKHTHEGFAQTLEALMKHPAYGIALGKNQGRGVAAGYWFNNGGESSAAIHVNEDGTVLLATGSADLSGTRTTLAMMAAETLGVSFETVRPIVADTASIGYGHLAAGSRTTFATGIAVVEAAKKIIEDLRRRAAMIWDVKPEAVLWEEGFAKAPGKEALSLKAIAAKRAVTGGPINTEVSVNAGGVAPGFAAELCDVEVDPETGQVKVLRFVAAQDVGRAIHPGYVEGQLQGGAAQGIGWALNEEYIYDEAGRLTNAGFLDYRVPVASDLPRIDTILVEVPNPKHPFGVKGVGEANFVPSIAAVANAVSNATGQRMNDLPMSPPKVLNALSREL